MRLHTEFQLPSMFCMFEVCFVSDEHNLLNCIFLECQIWTLTFTCTTNHKITQDIFINCAEF